MSPNVSVNISTTSTNGEGWTGGGPMTVEAYSVVLSAAALVLAAVLGGGGNLAVLHALFQSRRVRKYSYTLVLVFFFLGCGLGLLWAPLELLHLLTYHHARRSPTLDFGLATFAVYVFLTAGLAALLVAFCLENLLRLTGRFPAPLRGAWPLTVCVAMFLLSLLAAALYLCASLGGRASQGGGGEAVPGSYLLLHPASSAARLAILAVLVVVVLVGAAAVGAAAALTDRGVEPVAVKTSESFLSANTSQSESAHANSFFPPNQATSTGDVDKLSISVASSSKLPEVGLGGGESANVVPVVSSPAKERAEGSPRLGPLQPAPAAAPGGQRGTPSLLGINMAQVLGRRRHTICQIGDSSSPPDPIAKAKQYNYVRKFSVDISALQAQLENPKLFKDKVPFSSHQDINQQHNKAMPPQEPRPLMPLPNLPDRSDAGGGSGKGGAGGEGLFLPVPARPPVITVSGEAKEDGEAKEEEEDKAGIVPPDREVKEFSGRPEYQPLVNKAELTSIPRLPVTQPVEEEEEKEQEEDRDEEKDRATVHKEQGVVNARTQTGEEDDEQDGAGFKSANRLMDRDRDFVKMTLLMAATFLLCTFPFFLVEALRASLDLHTYINISTCTRSLSAIQIIIYPHIVICMDSVVKRAVQRLQAQLSGLCAGWRDADSVGAAPVAPDQGSSSTSQV